MSKFALAAATPAWYGVGAHRRKSQEVHTIGLAVSRLEEELFVGREPELKAFREWLTSGPPAPLILNVYGPGGVGKSALVHAFGAMAGRLGRPVQLLDGRNFRPSPEGLLLALGGGRLEEVVTRLGDSPALIVIDTFEILGRLTRYLQEQLLPALSTNVKIVISGRYPLGRVWESNATWQRLIRPMRLAGFSPSESREYLARRWLTDSRLLEQLAEAAGGHPLALSLAADMVLQLGVGDIGNAPEWHLVVRRLVKQLLRDVPRSLRELVEACAVVRHFDEATLAAISDRQDVAVDFDQLCRLSVVRATERGLVIHDDIRRILAQDLRWRRPDRYSLLRARAMAYYRERARTASPEDREQLIADRLFQWEHGLVQALLFTDEDPGRVWLDRGTARDRAELDRIWHRWLDTITAPQFGIGLPGEHERHIDHATFTALIEYPGTRIGVARDENGAILGFSTALPVCQESQYIIDSHPLTAATVSAYRNQAGLARLPATPAETNIFYFFHLAHVEEKADAVRAALIRSEFGIFALGGVYLVSTPVPVYKKMFEALGFAALKGGSSTFFGREHVSEAFVLDLSRTGVEPWIERVLSEPASVNVQLLGGFSLSVNGQAVPDSVWRLRKAKSLVKLLALAPGHQLHREQIMDRLWPEMQTPQAANNFHQALHIARRALASVGCGLILKDQMLTFDWPAPMETDVERFQRTAGEALASTDPGAYRLALDLYGGELLPEDLYDDWALPKRQELRDQYVELMTELGRLQETRGETGIAIASYCRALRANPLHEGAHEALMRLYAASGKRHEAIRQYEELHRLLGEELAAEPQPSTTRLYQELRDC